MSKLLIVESPAKANTIKKYLGKDYTVTASMGHVRDLPKKKFGVDIDRDFKPDYTIIKGKEDLVEKLREAAEKSDTVLLAADPDREGEAISWHLANILNIDPGTPCRVTFNEITRQSVGAGVRTPRPIDMNLVNAQQARRIVDRIVGYKLSPFLWQKVRRGLSAGRVQSVAVLLVVEREKEIRAFIPKEYWILTAVFFGEKNGEFSAKFYGGENKKKIEITSKEQCDKILEELYGAVYTVTDIKKKKKTVRPQPPFITSTLQQEASRRFGYQPSSTMRTAQQLYEGIDLKGQGHTGLITYMRTDSLRISGEAKAAAKEYISQRFGAEYLPSSSPVYKSKKNVQDAHEAIRPTDVSIHPESIRDFLSPQQYRLYKIIWERFLASQMAHALYDVVDIDIAASKYLFRAQNEKLHFPGFTVLYQEQKDEKDEDVGESKIPELSLGQILKLKSLLKEQKFTQPPARYTDASLIKTLEDKGIGRPSTYAPIITTIIDREYVEREQKALRPTPLGEVTTELFSEYYSNIIDVAFTANMEDKLDNVEEGSSDYISVIRDFYEPFEKDISTATEKLKGTRISVPAEETDEVCELCGRNMVIKYGRNGKFLACPGYPECKNAKSIVVDTGAACPVCSARVLEKKSKKGKVYFGCENNPSCPFMTWDKPLKDKCPQCGASLFRQQRRGGKIHCLNESCGYIKGGEVKDAAKE